MRIETRFGTAAPLEANMPRMKVYLVVVMLVCLGLAAPAGAECWGWVKKKPSSAPWGGTFMAYDKNEKKVALLVGDGIGGSEMALYYFDGEAWEQHWVGHPDIGYEATFIGAGGMYFDDNINALILFGGVTTGFEEGGGGAFRYIPGEGWHLLYTELFYGAYPQSDYLILSYDSDRKRAVMAGMMTWNWQRVTVEFDGYQYTILPNPVGISLHDGHTAFDPETKKTVFLGNGIPGSYEKGTFEYDGTTWIQIVDQQITCPGKPDYACFPVSLAYDPRLQGIVTVPLNSEVTQTWLYKDQKWEAKAMNSSITKSNDGLLAYDYHRELMILYSQPTGIMDGMETWLLKSTNHCRPVAKP